jgi:hypothetical protein
MLVAREIVIGDEEFLDSLPRVVPDDRFEIIGRAEPALAALYVDDRTKRTLKRTAAAESARILPPRPLHGPSGSIGIGWPQGWQMLHVIVDGLSCPNMHRARLRRARCPQLRRRRWKCPSPAPADLRRYPDSIERQPEREIRRSPPEALRQVAAGQPRGSDRLRTDETDETALPFLQMLR